FSAGIAFQLLQGLLSSDAALDITASFRFVKLSLRSRVTVLALHELQADLDFFRRNLDFFSICDLAQQDTDLDALFSHRTLLFLMLLFGLTLFFQLLFPYLTAISQILLFFHLHAVNRFIDQHLWYLNHRFVVNLLKQLILILRLGLASLFKLE